MFIVNGVSGASLHCINFGVAMDPTCGAGEYLLAALELKLDLLDKHYKRIPITVIHDTVTSIFGNDINTESIMITKLRIVLCILKRYGVDYIVGLAEKMRPNFLTYDYVVEEPGENKYDIIVGNPPYEDFIRGIEVKIPAGTTTPSYESVNRILGKIAEFSKVAADNAPNGSTPKFYLIVDEINRANLATVFGELIYGLEYRNSKVSTPYEVKEKATGTITKDIVLGKNLFILGTMNTADKSIDAIDYAIRRRFIFIDSPADRNVVMKCYQNTSGNPDEKSIELLLFDAVQHIFDDSRFFNNEYQKSDVRIGHT